MDYLLPNAASGCLNLLSTLLTIRVPRTRAHPVTHPPHICQKILTYLRRSRLDKTSVRVSITMPIPAAPWASPFATTGARRDHNISQSLIISQLLPGSRYSEGVCLHLNVHMSYWLHAHKSFLGVPEHPFFTFRTVIAWTKNKRFNIIEVAVDPAILLTPQHAYRL